jgi:hypothetical protein
VIFNKKYTREVFIGIILLIPIAFYLYKFGSFSFSSKLSDWTNFSAYLSGTVSPLVGAIAAFYAYKVCQATQEQLRQQKFVSCVEIYTKVYDSYINSITYKNHEDIKLTGVAIFKDFFSKRSSNSIKYFIAGSFVGCEKIPNDDLDLQVNLIKSLCIACIELENILPDKNNKIKFYTFIKIYSDSNLILLINSLAAIDKYEPVDPLALNIIKQVSEYLNTNLN